MPAASSAGGAPSAAELEILHQDRHLVAVVKPAWWVVHPTRGAKGAPVLLPILHRQLGRTLFPVHRLDRQTSGVLVLALSSDLAARMGDDLREGRWRKRYQALCRGVIRDSLRIGRAVPEGRARREALTAIDPVQSYCGRFTLVDAEPRTGRRHQIRYHMKHASHPIVGDTNYGQGVINRFFRDSFGLQRLFLHAAWLRLPHPGERRYLELHSPLPQELQRVLDGLSRHRGAVP